MTNEKIGKLQDAVKSAEDALAEIDKEAKPKTYARQEKVVEALKIAIDQRGRAVKAEEALKGYLPKGTDNPKSPSGDDTPKKNEKKKGFDYAEKAFLKVNDVEADEYPLVESIMEATGKTLEEVLDSKYFRTEQKELREAKASTEAIPEGSKRAGKTGKGSVDYYLAKNEMPPADQIELRREYVNAKIKREADKSKFTDNPVVR